jgi:hypothetical protein
VYESLTSLDLDRTDQVEYAYGLEEKDSYADSGDTLSMSTAVTDVISRTTVGDVWPVDVVGMHLFMAGNIVTNHNGEFRCVQRLNDADIKVVRIPDSEAPGFQTETGVTNWSLKQFTTNFATAANTDASYFSPWNDVEPGDMLFVGHRQIMWDKVNMTFQTVGADFTGVWEYFDNETSEFNPLAVTDLGSQIEFNINTLLGTANRAGAYITFKLLKTGAQETVQSVWAGGVNKVTTAGLLGQVTVSTEAADYSVTASWVPFDQQEDGTILSGDAMGQAGGIEWDLPETVSRQWLATDVNNLDGFWARFRVVTTGTPTEPSIDRVKISEG